MAEILAKAELLSHSENTIQNNLKGSSLEQQIYQTLDASY